MARERMVTRTVSVTECKVMCLRISTAEVTTDTLILSGTYEHDRDVLKAIKKLYETEDYKPTAVIETTEHEILYGMTEAKFIELAEALPPRKVYGEVEPTE